MPKALLFFLSLVIVAVGQQGQKSQDRTSFKKSITLFDPDLSPAAKAVQSLIQKGATEYRLGDYASAIKTFRTRATAGTFSP